MSYADANKIVQKKPAGNNVYKKLLRSCLLEIYNIKKNKVYADKYVHFHTQLFIYKPFATIMKNTLSLIFLTAICLWSCNKPKEILTEDKTISAYYTSDYITSQVKDNFTVTNIDSLSNFSELNNKINEIKCSNRIPGLTFSVDRSNYNLVGCLDCAQSKFKSCKGASDFIFIQNDSIIIDLATERKIHISELGKALEEINNGKYKYRITDRPDLPIIINLNVDDEFPIAMTKDILKVIFDEFEQTSQRYNATEYDYEIHFEPYDVL